MRQDRRRCGRKDKVRITQMETQCKKILDYMHEHDGITPLEALDCCGCFRLSARIKDLRDRGYIIRTEAVRKNGKAFARYVLEGHR